MAMVEESAQELGQRAVDYDLLTQRQLQEVWSQIGRVDISADEFLQVLLRRDLLTNYQAEKLAKKERWGVYFGHYKVLYFVGSGTFARVYRAVHKDTGKVVAVKVLRSKHSENPEQVKAFLTEGEVVSKLRHPNIVPIYDVYSKGNLHYLVMDFIEGRNLREFLKIRGKFDALEASRITADIAAGLGYAFERGLHHRDLKSSNVLISSKGQAKLVDFGLAGAEPGEAEEDEGVSNPRTVDYAGLEKATGVRKDDPRSDIFFLGTIYYNMLCGKPALLETRDRMQRMSKTRFETIEPILQVEPGLPRCVVPVVNRAMELNADKRYQSPQEMYVDLQAVLHRLKHPEPSKGGSSVPDESTVDTEIAPPPAQRAVMVVESNMELQNLLREKLRSVGYRVLVTQDPERALARLTDSNPAADCVIFSAGRLGEPALDAFNKLGDHPAAHSLPAVLLLDDGQLDWQARAKTSAHRVVVTMPIKLREFRATLAKLCPAT